MDVSPCISSSLASDRPKFRFLELPAELRLTIYAEVIKSGADLRHPYTPYPSRSSVNQLRKRKWSRRTTSSHLHYGPLLQANRQLRAEFKQAEKETIPPEIRVHIKDADFHPLSQFDYTLEHFKRCRWRKCVKDGTRLKIILHYNPKTRYEALAWAEQRAELSEYSLIANGFEMDWQVRLSETTLSQQTSKNYSPSVSWQSRLRQDSRERLPAPNEPKFSYDEHLSLIISICGSTHTVPGFSHWVEYDIREMFALIEAAMVKAHGRPLVERRRTGICNILNDLEFNNGLKPCAWLIVAGLIIMAATLLLVRNCPGLSVRYIGIILGLVVAPRCPTHIVNSATHYIRLKIQEMCAFVKPRLLKARRPPLFTACYAELCTMFKTVFLDTMLEMCVCGLWALFLAILMGFLWALGPSSSERYKYEYRLPLYF